MRMGYRYDALAAISFLLASFARDKCFADSVSHELYPCTQVSDCEYSTCPSNPGPYCYPWVYGYGLSFIDGFNPGICENPNGCGYYCASDYGNIWGGVSIWCPPPPLIPCSAGTWSSNGYAVSSTSCTACSSGSYGNSSGVSSCEECLSGTYSSGLGLFIVVICLYFVLPFPFHGCRSLETVARYSADDELPCANNDQLPHVSEHRRHCLHTLRDGILLRLDRCRMC